MKTRLSVFIISLLATFSLQAQTNERYIEVTGTSEIEIVPDRIHYLIEIREYFEEEFDGKSKPEEYRTKVPLAEIEQGLREAIAQAGIPQNAIRTEEIGDYWRQQGQGRCVKMHTFCFLRTKPRLSQAGALLLPKDFVSLSISSLL